MMTTIRFLKPNRYRRSIGEIDTAMGYGVHQALVQRGIAEFVSLTPEPDGTPQSDPTNSRGRKPRSKET